MTRLFSLGFACLFAIVLLIPGIAAAADVALVIGNANYRKAPNARSAEFDARAIADALADGGYDVTLGVDLNRVEMRRLLSRFGRKAADADKVVIFYSGHALRSDGVSYLAPVDQANDTLVEVMMDGVPLDLLLQLATTRRGQSVVLIDAAQLDGFRPNAHSEPGLAHIAPPDGVLVVSAAAPGHAVARRRPGQSRFADELLSELLAPGARAMQAVRNLRQPVWYTGSVVPRTQVIGRGGHRGRIGGDADSPADIEAALGLTRSQRREVQENLSLLGHDPRGIDGLFGPGTRTAIRLWQRANNLTETGYLTGEQLSRLREQARAGSRPPTRGPEQDYWARTGALGTASGYRSYLARYSDGVYAAEARDSLKRIAQAGSDFDARRERDDWLAAQRRDQPQDYRDYLGRYPTGIWQPEAEARLAELDRGPGRGPGPGQGPGPADPASEEAALGLTRNDRLSIEQRLNYLGFPPGPQDGFFDDNTRWAIEGYQRSRGFEATGFLSQPVISRIVEETSDVTQGIIINGAEVLRRILGGN